jgi:pyridoxine 5-phosphate synthase
MKRRHTKVNLEMAVTAAMVRFAEKTRPHDTCFVPEQRQELTTEGGLNVIALRRRITGAVARLQGRGINVALFIDPITEQIECAKETGAHSIEIHTGAYCNATGEKRARELHKIVAGARLAKRLGLEVHGGHGLDYENVQAIAGIPEIVELNIGHSIIARAVIVGIQQAVREMKQLLAKSAR